MTFEEFAALTDQKKLVTLEVEVGKELEKLSWESPPSGFSFLYCIDFPDGEVVSVEIDGVALTEVFSEADCEATASSFLYDANEHRLCIHTPDGDSPSTQESGNVYKYCIVAYFWIGFTNRQDADNPTIYARQDELLIDGELDVWACSDTDLTYWTEVLTGTSTIERDSSDVYDEDSAYSVKMTVDGGGNLVRFYQDIRTAPGRRCRIRVYYKMGGGAHSADIRIYDTAGNVYLDNAGNWQAGATSITLPNSTVWKEFSLEFIAHDSYSGYRMEFRSDTANSVIRFDYASFVRYRLEQYYRPYLGKDAIPSICHAVGDYYIADERLEFGEVNFCNDGWWWKHRTEYIYHNQNIEMRIGEVGSAYEDLKVIFKGICRKPVISDEGVSIELYDPRLQSLGKIPIERFNLTAYPNLKEGLEYMVIPILFGKKTNITPAYVNTTTFTFKVSQTIFNGVTYALESIDKVYKDGEELATPADYSVDLNAGTFTLTADPGESIITCDAHGIKCDMEDCSYSDNVADIWYFILTVLNEISPTEIHIRSFLETKVNRTQKLGLYLGSEVETFEVKKMLTKSSISQSFTLLDGKYVLKRYEPGVTPDTPRFYNEDYFDFEMQEITDQAFNTIVLKYDQCPTSHRFKYVSSAEDKTQYLYDEKTTLIIETALTEKAEAETLLEFYKSLVWSPANKLRTVLPASVMGFNPTDKGIFTKNIKSVTEDINVVSEEVYRILELDKNISTGQVEITALKDIQSLGYDTHTDTAHEDIPYEDSYIDSPHTDEPHEDVPHENGHSDVAYKDVAHQDSYTDIPHGDSHEDGHSDYYTDVPHGDIYNDEGEWPEPHMDFYTDEPHDDYHSDFHGDDHTDYHEDTYDDIAHTDSPHQDHTDTIPHEDVPHEDVPHEDEHTDVPHEDVEHVDSYY